MLDVSELCHLGSSDHSMIMVTLEGVVPRNTTYEEVPDWRKADLTLLRQELASVNWQLDDLSALQAWDCVRSEICKAEDKIVPKKRRRVNCVHYGCSKISCEQSERKDDFGPHTKRPSSMRSIKHINE